MRLNLSKIADCEEPINGLLPDEQNDGPRLQFRLEGHEEIMVISWMVRLCAPETSAYCSELMVVAKGQLG